MDPTTTLAELLDAALANDGDTVAECARNLADWIDRGGFLADFEAPPLVGAIERAYRITHD